MAAETNLFSHVFPGHKDGELGKAFLVKLNIDGSTCTASIIGDNWLITAAHCVEQIYLNLLNTGYKKETNYGDPELNLFDFPHLLDSYTVSTILFIQMQYCNKCNKVVRIRFIRFQYSFLQI